MSERGLICFGGPLDGDVIAGRGRTMLAEQVHLRNEHLDPEAEIGPIPIQTTVYHRRKYTGLDPELRFDCWVAETYPLERIEQQAATITWICDLIAGRASIKIRRPDTIYRTHADPAWLNDGETKGLHGVDDW